MPADIAVTIADLNRPVLHRSGQTGIVTGFDAGTVLVRFQHEIKSRAVLRRDLFYKDDHL